MENAREYLKYKKYPNRELFSSKISLPPPRLVERERKPVEERYISTARVSARRSFQIVSDIIECNDWQYFVTLTFGTQTRLNDSSVKKDWTNWSMNFRRRTPSSYYVAVPEYHKKGGLHIHMVIGGITAEQLQLVDSGFCCCSWKPKKCINRTEFEKTKSKHDLTPIDGLPIYNVNAWELGYSTATEILFKNGVHSYLTKYITKGDIDPRFCDAKRYWCSRNVKRPVVDKFNVPTLQTVSITDEKYNYYKDYISNFEFEFCDHDKQYTVWGKHNDD